MHDRIERAQTRLRGHSVSKRMQFVQRLFAFAALPVIITSCATADIDQTYDDIYITARTLERVQISGDQAELVGTFEIINRSNLLICFNEDVIVNRLSPYVQISRNNEHRDHGIPHPPVTTAIVELRPNDHREISRVVGYKTSAAVGGDRYTVSIRLWECNTSRPFVRRATLVD